MDDLHTRIVPVRVNRDHAPAWAERTRERREHALGLELERGARAIRLRRNDETVVGARAPPARNGWSSVICRSKECADAPSIATSFQTRLAAALSDLTFSHGASA